MPNNDMQYHMKLRQWKMNKMQNKMAEQTRIQELRDDPAAAAHSSRYKSYTMRLEKYSKNIEFVESKHRLSESYMQESLDILHRVREIAVQGSNGIYGKDEYYAMATEVNQLLEEAISLSNAKGGDGTTLFAGSKTGTDAFKKLEGHVKGIEGRVVTQVMYDGNIAQNQVEISDGNSIPANIPGNTVFWAEQQQIFSSTNALDYQVPEDTSFVIDGVEIGVTQGDNIHNIISKINNADVAVKADLDPVRNSIVLQTSVSHQIWMEEQPGSTVLQDLGLTVESGVDPPHNIAPSAQVFGGSVFDTIIQLRDNLYQGDTESIGSRGLKGIDTAMSNMLHKIAEVGSYGERIQIVGQRVASETLEMTARDSKLTDIDMAEAAMNLKMLETTHSAALKTAARIIQPTLLDFLR